VGRSKQPAVSARLLAQQLLAQGQHVIDVPPTLAARVRLLGSSKAGKSDPNDALSTAIAGLRHCGLRAVRAEDHTAVIRLLIGRFDDVTSGRTRAACRLHAVLRDLIPGGARRRLAADQAAKVMRRIRPEGPVATERKRLAADLLVDVRRCDRELGVLRARIAEAVDAAGTSLVELDGVGPIVAALIRARSGLGEVTVAKCYRFLRAVLNTAVDDEMIRRNPCRIKGAGGESSRERPVATPGQVEALVTAMPDRWKALVLLAVASSLRWGELMALTKPDVDLKRRTVRVVKSLSDDKGRMTLGPTKSEAGKRTVVVPVAVVPVLRAHMAEFSERRQAGRVFVGAKGATLRRTNFQATWVGAVKEAGLPEDFRFHDLRHTGNTWAADSGANLRELMERMGHSSTRAALIYLHAARDGHRRIADEIDRKLRGAQAPEDEDPDDGEGTAGARAPA
jgi:integrase